MGPGSWKVEVGDALERARACELGAFRLIYLDPPFFTRRTHRTKGGAAAFTDTWPSLDAYLDFLQERLAAMRPLLAEDGAVLLHLDWHAAFDAKPRCDAVFGRECFRNDIVWSYNSGGGSKRGYGHKHDTILWYGRTAHPYFDADAARVPYDAAIAKKRAHLFNPLGKVSGDVLTISRPPNHAAEWTGWPSQKPLELLRFLVRVHSAPGDLVGDFFCGSGTTLVAAAMEGRRAFGCDVSEEAAEIARGRLAAIGTGLSPLDPPASG